MKTRKWLNKTKHSKPRPKVFKTHSVMLLLALPVLSSQKTNSWGVISLEIEIEKEIQKFPQN